jgi:hypothetical protein
MSMALQLTAGRKAMFEKGYCVMDMSVVAFIVINNGRPFAAFSHGTWRRSPLKTSAVRARLSTVYLVIGIVTVSPIRTIERSNLDCVGHHLSII